MRIKGMKAALLLVPGLMCFGCSSGHNVNGGGDAAQKVEHRADQNQMNPQPRDKVRQGGTLTWPIDGAPANLNYSQIDNTQNGAWILQAVMPELYLFDPAGNAKYNPDYLTGEPKLETSPKQVVAFELNPKAIWYDGTPITAADYIAQWKALNGKNSAYRIASSNGYADIESVVQGASKYEVIVTFKKSYADWKSLFWPLYPASTSNDPNVFNTGWKDSMLTSGGPFRFQSFDATAKTYTLVPNEKWWGNKPKLDSIVFRVIDDDAMPAALANGEIDMMDIASNADYYDKVKAIPNIDIRVAGGPNFRHITVNGQSPMLQDVNVRQALAMSIDRTAIARAALGRLPVMPTPLGNHIFMANQVGYQDNSGVVAYDPSRAKQMLDAAGWVVQANKRVKDGKTLAINLVIPAGVAISRSEAELVQNMLGQVNVGVDINTVPSSDLFDKYITPGRFDFTIFAWLGTPFPIGSSQSIYLKPKGDNIQQNYARIGSDQLDQIFNDAVQELDPAKAIQKANDADKLIWSLVHSLTTYQRPDIWGVKKNLANMGAYGFAQIIYEDIGWMAAPADQ